MNATKRAERAGRIVAGVIEAQRTASVRAIGRGMMEACDVADVRGFEPAPGQDADEYWSAFWKGFETGPLPKVEQCRGCLAFVDAAHGGLDLDERCLDCRTGDESGEDSDDEGDLEELPHEAPVTPEENRAAWRETFEARDDYRCRECRQDVRDCTCEEGFT